MEKILESMVAKVTDSEPPILIETKVVKEPKPKVVKAPELESEVKESRVEELPNETLIDLPAQFT